MLCYWQKVTNYLYNYLIHLMLSAYGTTVFHVDIYWYYVNMS